MPHLGLLTRGSARPLPDNPVENAQNVVVDISAELCQHLLILGETKKQFSLTRAALRTNGRAKSEF